MVHAMIHDTSASERIINLGIIDSLKSTVPSPQGAASTYHASYNNNAFTAADA
jgi:hypothetical protein